MKVLELNERFFSRRHKKIFVFRWFSFCAEQNHSSVRFFSFRLFITMASDITHMDLYALLDAPETSTTPEIIRAFRKKALTCHPDKFPNDDQKKELFLLIKRASEILADDKARKSYDDCRQQKKRQQERLNQMDDKRKKMKETLERNEQRTSQTTATTPATPNNRVSEEKLRAEVERLRREGNRLVIEELEKLNELFQHDKQKTSTKNIHLVVKFLSKTTPYTESELRAIFGKYAPIIDIAILGNKRAMIEFQADQISKYAENEKGFIDRPFASVKIQGDASSAAVDSPSSVAMTSSKRPRDTIDLTQPDFEDYEAMIFKKMSEHAAKS